MARVVQSVVMLLVMSACEGALAQSELPPDRSRRRTPVVEVIERCGPAVVNISTTRIERYRPLGMDAFFDDVFDVGRPQTREREINSVGSGFLVHESGYIVTNAHVVGQTRDVRVTFSNKQSYQAQIIATDPEHDLAILKVSTGAPLPHLQLGRSDDIMIGETVIAIGNPLGLQHTATTGIVSALDRELRFSPQLAYTGLIQTDAAINPGNSGGPLLNLNGELIAINTAIRGDAQNVGFSIPVNRLWDLLPQMLDIEMRQRVRFGLRVNGWDSRVVAVRADSPAQKAGLRAGDRVLKFDQAQIRDGIDYYVHLLSTQPGKQVSLTVERDGKPTLANVTLEAVPAPDGAKLAKQLFGLKLAPVPSEIRQRLDLPENVGVWVDDVVKNSVARTAKFERHDLILTINRTPVSNLADVGLAMEGVAPGEDVIVDMARIDTDTPFRRPVRLRAMSGN